MSSISSDGDGNDTDHGIAGDEVGELILAIILRTVGPHRQHEVADDRGPRLRGITVAMCNELEPDRLGSAIVAASLASSLMLLVLRAHFEAAPTNVGIFALLAKLQTARALSAILTSPGQGWTLDELADVAATSRATLVRLFHKAVEVAPLAYLSELRLGLARHRIMDCNISLVVIAEDVGYQSESAFSRAYHRRFGVAPGADRRV